MSGTHFSSYSGYRSRFASVLIVAPYRFVDRLSRARGLRQRHTNRSIVTRAHVHFFPSPAQLLRNAAFSSSTFLANRHDDSAPVDRHCERKELG